MANKVIRGGVALRDARGQVARVTLYAQWGGAGGVFDVAKGLIDTALTALLACSNGVPVGYFGAASPSGSSQVLNPLHFGVEQVFQNAEDKARLVFTTAAFGLLAVSVPMPIGTGADNLFEADGETVDSAATNVAAFIAAMTVDGANGETMCNRSGTAVGSYVAGLRRRSPFQRKTTIYTLTPDETGPDE